MHYESGKMVVLLYVFSLACNSQTEMKSTCFQTGSRCCVFKADCSASSSHVTILYFCVISKSSFKFSKSSNEGSKFHDKSQLGLTLFPVLLILFSCCF